MKLSALVPLVGVALLTVVLVGGCAATEPTPAAPGGTGDGHGHIEGATEMPEPQLRLVTLDSAGSLTAFDPATEASVSLTDVAGAELLTSDGRYAFAAADARLTIVDTGTWTVPHGDHSHYYLAEPRVVGMIDGGAGAGLGRAASNAALTAVFFPGSGETVVLDGEALGEGEIEELARIEGEPHEGAAVPLGEQVLVSSPDAVQVYSAAGDALGDEQRCEDMRGSGITSVGVVFGCADGALLTVEGEDGVEFERIPYPAGATPAESFANRPGRPDLAAPAGRSGAWLLDTREREWTLIRTEQPLLRAVAVGDSDGRVVAIDALGRIVVLTHEGVQATSEPLLAADLVGAELPAGVVLEVDASRAYVNSPSAGLVHEIDYVDNARLARSLDVEGDASALVEVAR
ncbi:ABC transporter [Salinibacterium sp. SYSU T00001]|uniref:ABC transporter n=1 Tax=Homoserinimonas sedimenticola TaxID=2986805 RepID=UPI002235CB06|nr:ABC transporter [Salinibacterium sedimenticola]MCW4386300.1 ABC transporter [Salinibacterium sedimenticola]